MGVNFNWEFGIGNVFTLISALVIAGAFLFRKGGDLQKLNMAVTAALNQIAELKTEVSKIGLILTQVAVQNERMDNLGQRLNMMDKRYDELRRGDGWVTGHRTSIDGEYNP